LCSRVVFAALLAAFSLWSASCAVPLGPGYTIEKQEARVQFVTAPEPRIRIEADYQLKNTGNRPLDELEIRLPGRRFSLNEVRASWDAAALTLEKSPTNPRDTLMRLGEPWQFSARHTLRLSTEFLPAKEGETTLSFSKDAFFLPAAGWSAELLPPGGIFATGGVPPKKWNLLVTVPEGFQIHTSGVPTKPKRKGREITVLAVQRPRDPYPFVIAGRYSAAEIGKGKERLYLWTNKQQESAGLQEVSASLTRVIAAYDAAFGERRKDSSQTWIVECPVVAGCFTNLNPLTAKLLGGDESERTTAEMISLDTMVVDFSGGTPKLAAAAAPSLAASWLGYAQNPGFFEQKPPLSLFPAFAAALGHDAAQGTESREETIRRALRLIPTNGKPHQEDDPAVLRVKSFLFFYALQDRYGQEAFRKATQYMLYARRERGFELSDLIAAFERETHQNVAEFVRQWMKQPGVPEEFRARYEGTAAATANNDKETRP
jgi:hypothetical protein